MNKTLRNLALVALVAAPFSAFAEIAGTGTADDPWQISSKEDLCSAWNLPQLGVVNYFIQTADIDMAGVEDYIPLNVKDANWSRTINYDGQNHVIKNFGPKWHADGAAVEGNTNSGHYYVTSIFGVVNGVVKNLGVVDANLNTAGAKQRAGILCGYAGSSSSTQAKDVLFENVFVTGTVKGGNRNTGGLAGLNQLPVIIKNCFVNLDMSCEANQDGNAMLIGESQKSVTIETSYVAGKVSGPCNFALDNIGANTVTVDGFVVFAEGADAQLGFTDSDNAVTMANTTATKADGLEEVKDWAAFSKTETIDGYPALEYGFSGEGTEESPYIIDGQRALCNAWKVVKEDVVTYFSQTADVDMAGVTDYTPFIGYTSAGYNKTLNYNGNNHVIKNFAPTSDEWLDGGKYCYGQSIFGVFSGELYDLGVVNATVGKDDTRTDTKANQGRAGIIGGYLGHSNSLANVTKISNVFVEGTITGSSSNYSGGFGGTNGTSVLIENCFANVDFIVSDADKANAANAALIGRVNKQSTDPDDATNKLPGVELVNVYVAGTVENANLLFGSVSVPVTLDNVICFNTGSTVVGVAAADLPFVEVPETEEEVAEDIKEVQGWTAFSDTKLFNGYPILKGFEALGEESGIFEAAVEVVEEANGPAVYYNLQGVQVANPDNGIYIVRRGNKVTKELIRK